MATETSMSVWRLSTGNPSPSLSENRRDELLSKESERDRVEDQRPLPAKGMMPGFEIRRPGLVMIQVARPHARPLSR
jgi:hypothetical protein